MSLGPLDSLLNTFGPFVLPVLLFVGGLVGYLVLLKLSRTFNAVRRGQIGTCHDLIGLGTYCRCVRRIRAERPPHAQR